MRLRRKIPSFIFGVSIGLVIGVGFFAFKIGDVLDRLRNTSAERITVIEQPVKNVERPDEKNKKDRERFRINLNKSAKVDYSEVDSLIRDNSEINIAIDELLSVKNIKVIRLGDNFSGMDSAAARLANVGEPMSDLYFVEFWKTPLNSSGYRFSKNKIMLYGFQDSNNVLLYRLDNMFYLRSDEQVFRLSPGGDFRPLERVADPGLLAKIN